MSIYNRKTGEEKFKGMVLKVWGTFQMDMSFDEVLYWCEESQTSKTTRICGDWWAEVDASEEIRQKYMNQIESQIIKSEEDYAEQQKRVVKVGSVVKVVRGRKMPKEVVFKVTRIEKMQFGTLIFNCVGDCTYIRNVQVEVDGKFQEPIKEAYKKTVYFRAI